MHHRTRNAPALSLSRSFASSVSALRASPHLFDVGGGSYAARQPAAMIPMRSGGRALRMLMFGKPGSGKGTLSGKLTDKYEISFLSTGDSLRRHIAEKSEVGKIAKELVANGAFLPDEVMMKVVETELGQMRGQNWILDGFPRTLSQARMVDDYLGRKSTPLTLVVHLDVPDSVILARIRDRWTHLPSGRVYNLSYNPPKREGLDDVTGEPLSKRPDDNPEVFKRRIETFRRETAPILTHYSAPGSLARVVSVKGNTSDEIWPQLEREVLASFDVQLKSESSPLRVEEEVIRIAEEKDGLKAGIRS